jgi:hypothetical protein
VREAFNRKRLQVNKSPIRVGVLIFGVCAVLFALFILPLLLVAGLFIGVKQTVIPVTKVYSSPPMGRVSTTAMPQRPTLPTMPTLPAPPSMNSAPEPSPTPSSYRKFRQPMLSVTQVTLNNGINFGSEQKPFIALPEDSAKSHDAIVEMYRDGKLDGIDVIADIQNGALDFIDCDVMRSSARTPFSIHPENAPVIIPSSSEPVQRFIISNTPCTFIIRTHPHFNNGWEYHEGSVEVVGMSRGQHMMLRFNIVTRDTVAPKMEVPVIIDPLKTGQMGIASTNGYTYVVQRGQTTLAILKAFNAKFKEKGLKPITFEQLEASNPELNFDKLRMGEKLIIPATSSLGEPVSVRQPEISVPPEVEEPTN